MVFIKVLGLFWGSSLEFGFSNMLYLVINFFIFMGFMFFKVFIVLELNVYIFKKKLEDSLIGKMYN